MAPDQDLTGVLPCVGEFKATYNQGIRFPISSRCHFDVIFGETIQQRVEHGFDINAVIAGEDHLVPPVDPVHLWEKVNIHLL